MKNKLIKMLSLILCLVLVLMLFSGCPPYEFSFSLSAIFVRYNLLFSNALLPFPDFSIINIRFDSDEYERILHEVSFPDEGEHPSAALYFISYSERDADFKYNPDTSLHFVKDKNNKDEEAFQAFLKQNNWNEKKKYSDRKSLVQLNKSSSIRTTSAEIISKTYDPQNRDKYPSFLDNAKTFFEEQTGITNAIYGSTFNDEYSRDMMGYYFFDEKIQDYRLFAVCFIAFFDSHLCYYSDTPIMEIDLDNYLEDLATFKKLNNWGEPITVEEIEALPKYVAEELDVTPTETPSETPATT